MTVPVHCIGFFLWLVCTTPTPTRILLPTKLDIVVQLDSVLLNVSASVEVSWFGQFTKLYNYYSQVQLS